MELFGKFCVYFYLLVYSYLYLASLVAVPAALIGIFIARRLKQHRAWFELFFNRLGFLSLFIIAQFHLIPLVLIIFGSSAISIPAMVVALFIFEALAHIACFYILAIHRFQVR